MQGQSNLSCTTTTWKRNISGEMRPSPWEILGAPQFIPDLALAVSDPEEVVRGYAAWALGRIGGKQAQQILEASLSKETSGGVNEIEAALAVVQDQKYH